MKMESQIRLINIEQIIPNRFQPRLQFDQEGLTDLANSIVEHGIIQPLVLRRVGDKFEIIAGERRYKAAQIAGLTTVPAIITDLDDNESAEVAIIENTHRRNLSAIEEAKSYKKLLDRRYVTQDQLAKRLGVSQSTIANKIRLLTLDEAVQDALINEKISERHARSLLRVTDKLKQVELLNKVIQERWPVRRLEEEIDQVLNSYKNNKNYVGGINANSKIDVNVNDIMNNATDLLIDNNQPSYSYNVKDNDTTPKKESLFFNNLENEAANMDTSLNFWFNPFKTAKVAPQDVVQEYELLDSDDDDVEDNSMPTKEEIKPEIPEEKYETMDDVIAGIKKIIKTAQTNGIHINTEEFSFDKLYQVVVKIDK